MQLLDCQMILIEKLISYINTYKVTITNSIYYKNLFLYKFRRLILYQLSLNQMVNMMILTQNTQSLYII